MSMSNYVERLVEAEAIDYFVGENIGGLKVDGMNFNIEDLGDYHIWLSGYYSEDFMYMLKNDEYYGEDIRNISKSLNQIAEEAYDRPDDLKKDYIQKKVDELWITVEAAYDDIFENVIEGLSEQLMYASNSFQDYVNGEFISSTVGGVEVDEFKIADYFDEIGNRLSIAVFEEASIELKSFNKETLLDYVESY